MSNTKILLLKDLVLSANQYTFECYGRANTDTAYWEKVNGDVSVFRHPRYSGVGYFECKVYLTLKRSMIHIPIPSALCILLNQKTSYGSGKCYFVGKGEKNISETVPAEIDLSDEFDRTGNIKLEIQPCDNQLPLYFSTPPIISYLYESDIEPTVSSLELVELPNNTEYVSGFAFDRKGMKIRARYTDGSYRFIDDYSVTPSTMSQSTTYVTVSYGGKSVNVPITVKADYDVIDIQANPKGVCFDNPKVDLKTGRLLYTSQDMSVGENSFEIGVSHVYSSLSNDIIDREFSCFGKGWKLNLSQYVKKSVDGNNYKYIDDMGYTHVFVKFDGNRYYDTSDAGTTLTDETDGALITDVNGNKMKFNTSGQISYTQSALNPEIKKCFEYSSGKLTRVYDNRHKSKGNNSSIEFRYSGGLLQGMARKNANNVDIEFLSFNYNSNKQLVLVEKMPFLDSGEPSKRRIVSYYEYDEKGNLTKIIEAKTKSAITVGYTDNNVKYIASGIVNGDTKTVNSYDIDTKFIEKHRNTIENVFKRGGGSLREVNIVNERGVKSCLQFNTRNENISTFEIDGTVKRTLSREIGIKVSVNGSESDSINGESTRRVSTSGLELRLGNITDRAGEDEYLNYLCTVWVKHSYIFSDRLRAKLTIQNRTTYAEIDSEAKDVWQKVCIPVFFLNKDKKTNVGTINLKFENFDGAAKLAEITCMRLCPSESQEMFFGTESVTNSVMLASDQKINYRNMSNVDVNLCNRSGVYITQNDVTRAVTQPIARGDRYDLICCGGTKRIANVKSLHFSNNSGGEMFGGSCFYLLSNSLDHRVQTKTEFSTAQLSNGNGLIVRQIVKSYANGIGGDSSSEDVTSIKSAQYDAYGRVIRETDAYGIMTEYEYDNDIDENNYGNIKRQRVYGSNNGSQTTNSALVYEYAYDKHGEKVVGSTDGVTSQAMLYGAYDEPKGIVYGGAKDFNKLITSSGNPLIGKRQVKYEYDVFKESITQIIESGANKWKSNAFTYENGRVRTVSDGAVKYKITRTLSEDKVTTSVFDDNTGSMLLEKESNLTDSETISKIFNGADVYIDTVTLDKYGRLGSVKSEGGLITNTLTPTYETIDESRSCANIIEFAGISYTYNESGNLVQEFRNFTDDKKFSISGIGYGETRYGFISNDANDSYKTKIVYDKNCIISPRITQTRFYYSTHPQQNVDNWIEQSCYADDYSYDAYGRLSKINHNGNFADEYEYCDTGDSISPLVKKYIHKTTKVSDSCKMEQTLSYDDMGRVTRSITLLGGLNGYEVLASDLSYTYDSLGYITKEVKNGVSTVYTYDGIGRLASKGGKSFTYNAGKLTSIQGVGSYSYDFYGNRSQVVKSDMTREFSYSHGNQLTRITQNKSTLAEYEVDFQGLRYQKDVSNVKTEYYYDGAKLIGENCSNGIRLRFVYGAKGLDGVILIHNNTQKCYKYVIDLLGNVIGIDNIDGLPLLRFEYDLFGKFTAKYPVGGKWFDTVGIDSNSEAGILLNASPFFWKGYYFDRESGYYYINGRYYDPETGTFLDADNIENIAMNAVIPGGLDRLSALIAFGVPNLLEVTPNSYNIFTTKTFSVDGNNKSEDGSELWRWIVGALVVVGVTVGAMALTGGAALGIAAAMGSSLSAALSAAGAAAGGAAIGGIIAGGVNLINQGIQSDWKSLDLASLATSTAIGGVFGGISGGIGHISNVALSSRLLGKGIQTGARYFRHLGMQVTSNMIIGNTVNLIQRQISNTAISINDIIIANLGGIATSMGSSEFLQIIINLLIEFGIEFA